jgi:Tol biopolymer transport system component
MLTSKSQLPETDIFLCTVKKDSSGYIFSTPENITDREGYDNQPSFSPDTKKILYTAVADSLQSDIYSYDIELKASFQITSTAESEYSPAFTPDNSRISVVRVDTDSAQRFYTFPFNQIDDATLIKNTDGIGYACILNDSLLAMFILGKAHTLQVLNVKNSERKLIASDIGRCMKLSPDKSKMFFIIKSNPAEWYIYAMNCSDFSLTRISKTPDGCEDFAIFPDGSFVMGSKGKLYLLGGSNEWKEIADFSKELTDFYRVSVSNDGSYIALVAFRGKKP